MIMPDHFFLLKCDPPTSDSCGTVNFIVFLVVLDSNNKPVLIIEIKDEGWAQKAELLLFADNQMPDRYGLMLDACPTPRLWGLSVLSTSVGAIY